MKNKQTPAPIPVYNVPFKITILVNDKLFHRINTMVAVDAKDKETAIEKAKEAANNLKATALTFEPEKVGIRYFVGNAPKIRFQCATYDEGSIKAVALVGATIRIDCERNGEMDHDTFAMWGDNRVNCENAFNDLLKKLNIKK